jgi:hypothetical protein
MKEFINRYNDVFTFEYNEKGNIQWSGNFKHCRFGVANVYNDAYNEYKRDGGTLSMKEFIEEVHYYDPETFESSEISKTYRELVYSDWNTIAMVDPSGGPYISKGFDMSFFEMKGKVNVFIPNEDGYEIVIDNG